MKITMTTLKKLAAVILFFGATTFATAQMCPVEISKRSGTVYAGGPAKIDFKPDGNDITVRIAKTDGRARTTVNVYANNSKIGDLIFENNRSPETQSKTFRNVANKNVRVEIINQSVANKFKYTATINGESNDVTTGGAVSGTLVSNVRKTIYTNGSCTPYTKIEIRRTGGRASGNIRVWEKIGRNWTALNQYTKVFEGNDPSEIFTVNSNNEIKVELRNVSVGNTLSYTMKAEASSTAGSSGTTTTRTARTMKKASGKKRPKN